MNIPWFTLEIECVFAAYSVNVNGIVQATDRNLPNRDERFPINQWISTGANALEARVWMLRHWETRPPKMSFTVKVCKYTSPSSLAEVLLQFNWSLTDNEDVDQEFPIVFQGNFNVTLDFPAWSWRTAEILPEDFTVDPGLRNFLAQVHQTMSAKDVDGMIALMNTKALEMAAAFGITAVERLKDQREFFTELFANPRFAMKPLDRDGLRWQRHAEGRLVEMTDRFGEPTVSTVALDGDAAFGLELFLCRKDGAWRICR